MPASTSAATETAPAAVTALEVTSQTTSLWRQLGLLIQWQFRRSLPMLPLFIIMNLFSGATTSRSNMPELARALSEYWPSTQYAIYSQSVIFRGAGLHELWPQLLIMGIAGILFLGLALIRFRKMLEQQN